MRYFFRSEYDGTSYGGWQRQKNAPSVQACLEEAFATVTRCPCKVMGAGRTDAGVHARGQGVHVDVEKELSVGRCETAVNGVLPPDIGIRCLQEVAPSFHARYSAEKRTYKYYLTARKSPLLRERAWYMRHKIDWGRAADNAAQLSGTHDFSAFCSSNTTTKNMTCTVYEASLAHGNDTTVFTISANRYVYKMVRSIVGTLIDIGRGEIELSMAEIAKRRNRALVGQTAPAHGLVLEHVEYPGGI